MKSDLKSYKCIWEKELNKELMNKSNDAPLVDYIIDSWKSLEVIPQIKFVDYEYTEKESEIDINKFIFKRDKKRKKKEKFDVKFILDDRCGKLTVHLEITMVEIDPKTGEKTLHVYPIKKSMLIPLQDANGLYHLRGKDYYLIWQMLEKSTYTSKSSITLKSLMPVALKRNLIIKEDVEGNEYKLPCYYVYVFRKEVPCILFYLSRGLYNTLDYLEVSKVLSIIDKDPKENDERNIYFELSNRCWVKVDREFFNKYPYIQSVVGAFCTVCTNRVSIEQLNDPKQWIKRITNPNNYEKGLNTLKFFNRLLDRNTQKMLLIPDYHKTDSYSLIRWMMQNFNQLRMKDNCSLENKRLRCNEYISSLMDLEFSNRLKRIVSLGDKATIENIREIFKFPGDILIQKMHASGILRFDDSVNDMSFWSSFKYTSKGPNSLGTKNGNNISMKYRGLHPSMLGRLDILVCGNSDPGTSGLISPFVKMDGLFFNSDYEPYSFYYNLLQDLEKRGKNDGNIYIGYKFDNEKEFYDTLYEIEKYDDKNITVWGTSRTGSYDMIIEESEDIDDGKTDEENKESSETTSSDTKANETETKDKTSKK